MGADEVDEDLHDEIQQECGKYGKVQNVVIYQVLFPLLILLFLPILLLLFLSILFLFLLLLILVLLFDW